MYGLKSNPIRLAQIFIALCPNNIRPKNLNGFRLWIELEKKVHHKYHIK